MTWRNAHQLWKMLRIVGDPEGGLLTCLAMTTNIGVIALPNWGGCLTASNETTDFSLG